VVAYDAATGRLLWSHRDPVRYATTIAGVGPRATPTIEGGRVFTMGATGVLNALDLATGRRLWTHDVLAEHGATSPEWGKAVSPLVVDGRVIVSAGGPDGRSLVAYDAASGEHVWAAGSDQSSYSSPLLLTLAGRRQVVILNQGTVAAHDPATGALLWVHPFPSGQPNVTTPLPLGGDRLLVSVGYGIGSKSYRIAANGGALSATMEWQSPRLKSKFGNLVRHGGSVYGLDDGVLTCIDPATGERRWKEGRYGHGQLLLAGGLLIVQTEEGEIVLIEPTPDGLRELTRFQALEGKTWNPPALAGRLLLVRNDREAAAYLLPVE
jgi:outer membrane protein assembly factor BamB